MTGPGDKIMERFRRDIEEGLEHRVLTSPLVEWMAQHRDQAVELLKHGHMNWTKAAAAFAGSGMEDHLGQPPTAETARETWERVEERRRAGMKLRKAK